MGPLPILVYFAAVAKGTLLLAEYMDGQEEDFREDCVQLVERMGNYHSRYSFTVSRRTFCCLMEDGFAFCAIVDEALSNTDAFAFLDEVRDALRKLLKRRGLPIDGEGLGPHSLDAEFGPVMRRLAAPYVGIPQEDLDKAAVEQNGEADHTVGSLPSLPERPEEQVHAGKSGEKRSICSFSPSRPKGHKSDKKKVKDQVSEVKEIMMGNSGQVLNKGEKLEILVGGTSGASDYQMNGHHGTVRMKGQQQLAQRTWWRNVKLVLLLDVIVCLVLFLIWLGICRGFQCLSNT